MMLYLYIIDKHNRFSYFIFDTNENIIFFCLNNISLLNLFI